MDELLAEALCEIAATSDYDYYDGDHVWCRFCRRNRPTPADDAKLEWHDRLCIYRVARELYLDKS